MPRIRAASSRTLADATADSSDCSEGQPIRRFPAFEPAVTRSFEVSDLARAAVDPIAIAGFVYLGELSHGNDPLVVPWLYLDTLAPFLIGWAAVAMAAATVGYSPLASRAPVRTAAAGVGLWIPACLIGLGLRSSSLFHGGAPLAFALVALGIGGAAVAVGRVAAVLLWRQMSL